MKKALQLSALLFAAALLAGIAAAAIPTAQAGTVAVTAPTAQPMAYSAPATGPALQNQTPAQPQNQTPPPPNTQNPNQNPNAMPPATPQNRRLPKTASPLPELALIGFLSLLGIVVLRKTLRNPA